jgi:heme a synthase
VVATVSERMAMPRSGASAHGLFRRFAWAVLGWNLLVVVWGAYVRASGSGAGCGSHWPLCNGEVMPRAPRLETIIEFTHRLMSGVALFAVIGLCIWAFRAFPRGHRVRWMATLSVAFLLLEALLGAGLVLFEYVDKNASVGRAIYLSAHLVNTQLLLAVLALTAWFARPRPGCSTFTPRASAYFTIALPLALAVSVTGAIAALGDTLFPATSLSAGFQQDFSDTAHFLLRLRILHPILAVASGAFFLLAAITAIRAKTQTGWALAGLVLIQLCAGAMNLALLAPVWMQLIHLLLADLIWIALVLTAAETRRYS